MSASASVVFGPVRRRTGSLPDAGRRLAACGVLAALAALVAAPAPAEPAQGRGGFYLGVLGAYTASKETGSSRRGDGQFGSNANQEQANGSTRGGGAGGVVGYQLRHPSGIIAGLEADWVGLSHRSRQDTLVDGANAWFGLVGASIRRETEWISTARLRLGYGEGPWMVSATAGLAAASMVQMRTQYQGVLSPTQTVARFSDTDRAVPIGWTLGLGGAWQIDGAWSLRLDYLYTAFDEVPFKFPDARGGVAGSFNSRQGRDVSNDVTFHTLRLGVTYALGRGS